MVRNANGKMVASPKSNYAACELWASFIGSREAGPPSMDVNSICVRGDEIWSFGSHFPMAKIVRHVRRDPDKPDYYRDHPGKVKCVYVNTTYWSSMGFANTNDDQANVRTLVKHYAEKAGVPVYAIPLNSGRSGQAIYIEASPEDPEPVLIETHYRNGPPYGPLPGFEIPPAVPRKNVPVDPGPEPVKHPFGCIAGTLEEYESEKLVYDFQVTDEQKRVARAVPREDYQGKQRIDYYVDCIEKLYYGEKPSTWNDDGAKEHGIEHNQYKQCPHCAAFDREMHDWRVRENGGKDYQTGEHFGLGWIKYKAWLDFFHGDIEEWAHARSAIWILRRKRKKLHDEWLSRNTIPFDSIRTKRMGNVHIPLIDPETGKVKLADGRRYLRERDRAAKRHAKDMKRQMRERIKADKMREAERIRIEAEKLALRTDALQKWDEAGIRHEHFDPELANWMLDHGLTPNEDNTVRIVKRVDTVLENDPDSATVWNVKIPVLRPRAGNREFKYPNSGYVEAMDYLPNGQCAHGLHFSANFREAIEVFYGDTMIECDVDLDTMQVIWSNKVKAKWCNVVRVVPEGEWKAAQSEAA